MYKLNFRNLNHFRDTSPSLQIVLQRTTRSLNIVALRFSSLHSRLLVICKQYLESTKTGLFSGIWVNTLICKDRFQGE